MLGLITVFCCILGFREVLSDTCSLPLSLLCSSPEVAEQCDVVSQCEPYLEANERAPLVNFSLYYESLCPFCKEFVVSQLYPAFKSIGSIMRLNLVPYGNAFEKKVGDKWQFTCQHGGPECYGNLIETCAIHFYPNTSDHFPFIYCIEKSNLVPKKSASMCAEKLGLDYSKIKACAAGPLGNRLEHDMALKTDNLKPVLRYVPWVTLNGVHTKKIEQEARNNLKRLICETYTGHSKPEACSQQKLVW